MSDGEPELDTFLGLDTETEEYKLTEPLLSSIRRSLPVFPLQMSTAISRRGSVPLPGGAKGVVTTLNESNKTTTSAQWTSAPWFNEKWVDALMVIQKGNERFLYYGDKGIKMAPGGAVTYLSFKAGVPIFSSVRAGSIIAIATSAFFHGDDFADHARKTGEQNLDALAGNTTEAAIKLMGNTTEAAIKITKVPAALGATVEDAAKGVAEGIGATLRMLFGEPADKAAAAASSVGGAASSAAGSVGGAASAIADTISHATTLVLYVGGTYIAYRFLKDQSQA